jgi:hydrogenase maturation factor
MCLGSIVRLEEAWDEDGVRVGRLAGGAVVPLSFVPEAAPGEELLVHLGIPVEVLAAETARDAQELRTTNDEEER